MYYGIAKTSDGRTLETTGTIMEVAAWADRIVSESIGAVEIKIREVEQ